MVVRGRGMVGKRAVKSEVIFEFMAARLPTLRDKTPAGTE